MSRSYRQLYVWQKAKKLAGDVYRETANFPRTEIYGLTSQIRRSAVSIPANIAEGQGRLTRGEFKQFLGHARGSLLELETHLAIACDLGFLIVRNYEVIDRSCYELLGLLNRLLTSLESKSSSHPTASPAAFKL
ncbi:MAG: four helix bundle protein [Terriglobales bacterium]